VLSPTLLWSAQSPSSVDWSIAYLDQVLANVQPGDTTARVGDMDILVRNLRAWRDELAGNPSPQSAFDRSVPTWTGGNVYYTFATTGSNAVPAAEQSVFLDGANEWATFANIHFIPWTTQANYVLITQLSNSEGGFSAVGMVGGQQILEIGPTSWNRPTICHEIGHTLGLVHEHQRSDRDSYVTILTNNVIPSLIGNFVLLSNSTNKSTYDFLSIMHYSRNTFSTNPAVADTIEPLPAYSRFLNIMGVQDDPVLSASDRAGMAAMYGAGPPLSSVVTNTQDSGPGSLRAAIYYAFDHPGTTITFNIPGTDPGRSNNVFNIQPSDKFPSLVNATTLDGSTEPVHANPNGPSILLNGARGYPGEVFANGLRLGGTNCTVRSLVINGFSASGILIDSTNATANVVAGCYLGTDPSGTTAVTNYFPPLTIDNGASSNLVGGATAAARNIISGSAYQGLVIRDPGTKSNLVEGNYIGLNATGTAALSNRWSGVAIFNGAQSNSIGGVLASAGNTISGNGLQGITISDPGTRGNVVQGNYIGLNPAGTLAISNNAAGVTLFNGAQSNLIGGVAVSARNIISGNLQQGVSMQDPGTSGNIVEGNYIGLNPSGTAAIGNGWSGVNAFSNASGNIIGVPAAPNVISGNGFEGVLLQLGAGNNVIRANLVGLNAAGSGAISNGGPGISVITGAASNLIGGTLVAQRNFISGNGAEGVLLADNGTSNNIIQGNYIGVNPSGTGSISNAGAGVELYYGPVGTLIGGTAPGAGNLVSGNGKQGVLLQGNSSNNVVQGNWIGVDPTGTGAISNGGAGLELYYGPQNNLIGGGSLGASNIISGNGLQGVLFQGSATSGNSVWGNYIGVSAAGSAAIPNGTAGIEIYNGPQNNFIGGAAPGEGNVISGNGTEGIVLDFGSASNLVRGNFIGLNSAGTTAVPNGSSGIQLYSGVTGNSIGGLAGARNFISGNSSAGIAIDFNSSNNIVQGNSIGANITNGPAPNGVQGVILYANAVGNQIGGTAPGAANLIAFNAFDAIDLFDSSTTNNSIRGNSIFGNGGGIVLISGANGSANAPSLSSAVVATNTTVSGTLSGLASTVFHLDFYLSPPPAAQAQGTIYLGAQDVTTGAGGSVSFSVSVPATVPIGRIVSATATDPSGNTSALSSGVTVTAIDSVGDGIPDAWRRARFGGGGTTTNAQSCATCDPDHDGLSNLQEFLAGTNPTNASSTLRISHPTESGTNTLVSFPSVLGTVYRVEFRDDVAGSGWTLLADQVIGTGGVVQIIDSGSLALPRRFYRLDVLP